jgi:hypothetical protein
VGVSLLSVHIRYIRRPVCFVTLNFDQVIKNCFLAADQKQCYQGWNFELEIAEGPLISSSASAERAPSARQNEDRQ